MGAPEPSHSFVCPFRQFSKGRVEFIYCQSVGEGDREGSSSALALSPGHPCSTAPRCENTAQELKL